MNIFFKRIFQNKFWKQNWKYIVSLLIMVFLIFATFHTLFRQTDFDTFKECLKKSDIRFLLGTIFLVFIFIYSEGASFRVIMNALGQKISRKSGFVYASVDIYFSYITPSATGGQPLMMYYMSKDKIHASKSGLVILMYTSFYSLSLVIVGIWAFIFYHPYLFTLKKGFVFLYFIGMGLCLFLTVICLLAMFSQRLTKRCGASLISLLARLRIVKNRDKKIRNLLAQLRDYRKGANFIRKHPLVSLRAFLWIMLQRLAMLTTTYLVYRSFGLTSSSFFELLALQTFLTSASYAIPIPGAVGASEGMFVVLFGSVFGSFLMPGLLLSRGINFYFSLVICAVVTIGNQFRLVRNEKKHLKMTSAKESL